MLDEKHLKLGDLWNKFFYEEWYRWQRPNELVHRSMAMFGGAEGLADRLTDCRVKVIGTIPIKNEIFESCLEGRPIQGRVAAKEVDGMLP